VNLISCDNCGVIMDANKLTFPVDVCDYGGEVDNDKAGWNGSDYVPKVSCPVCKAPILKSEGG